MDIGKGVERLREERPGWSYFWPLYIIWESGFSQGYVMGAEEKD